MITVLQTNAQDIIWPIDQLVDYLVTSHDRQPSSRWNDMVGLHSILSILHIELRYQAGMSVQSHTGTERNAKEDWRPLVKSDRGSRTPSTRRTHEQQTKIKVELERKTILSD